MHHRTTGIILRTRPLTESSRIVEWLTADAGRISTVAKGARRPASPFRGKLDLFYLAEISFMRSRRSGLHTLREVSLVQPHATLRRDLGWLNQASYAVLLIEQTTERETPVPGIYSLFAGLLDRLPDTPPRALTLFVFELQLLRELGLAPDLARAELSPGSMKILDAARNADAATLPRLRLSEIQEREIQRYLQGFLVYHLGRLPPGRNAALNLERAVGTTDFPVIRGF